MGQDQHLSTFSNGQVAPEKKLQQFQPSFCEHFKKLATSTCCVFYFLARLSQPWLRDLFLALESWLDYTALCMNFYLNLTVLTNSRVESLSTKIYLYFHVPLPYWPGKANPPSLSSRSSAAGALVAGVARPRQLPCPDYLGSGTYSHANFFHSMLLMPPYITPSP